jgi:hypothetical protein
MMPVLYPSPHIPSAAPASPGLEPFLLTHRGDCLRALTALQWRVPRAILKPMPKDPFIREKFTRERAAARKLAAEYFERFPKDRYQTEVESWRNLQSANIEFTMKRLREPNDEGENTDD